MGALFTSRITELLGAKASLHITPEVVRRFDPAARAATSEAFADAITRVFAFGVPLLLLGFVLSLFLKEKPLRTSSGDIRRAAATLELDFAEDALIALADPSLPVASVESARNGHDEPATTGSGTGAGGEQ
jgi:hypothetical protein